MAVKRCYNLSPDQIAANKFARSRNEHEENVRADRGLAIASHRGSGGAKGERHRDYRQW